LGKVTFGGGIPDHMLMDGLGRVLQHTLEVARQLLLLEQLLSLDLLLTQLLILDAIH
jgi:hypothetical protein